MLKNPNGLKKKKAAAFSLYTHTHTNLSFDSGVNNDKDKKILTRDLWSVVYISLCAKANIHKYTEMVGTI